MAAYVYDDFRVTLTPGSWGSYTVRAVDHDGTAVTGAFEVPLADDELERAILGIARGTTRRAAPPAGPATTWPTRDVGGAIETPVDAEQLGGSLADALLADEVGALYDAARRRAASSGHGLRLTLSLAAAPALLSIPWEFLYRRPRFLANQRHFPLVRHLEIGAVASPPAIEGTVHVLGVVASPAQMAPLDVAAERARVERAVATVVELGRVELDWLEPATPRRLREALRDGSYDILHFVGHSDFTAQGDGLLYLEGPTGEAAPVDSTELANLLSDQTRLRLVVLNSCEGARTTLTDSFAGVATTLVQLGVPAVVAMQFPISDRAAILFAEELYTNLIGRQDPIDAAVAEARKAIYIEIGNLEWATPVLFMSDTDVELFRFALPAAPLPPPPPPVPDDGAGDPRLPEPRPDWTGPDSTGPVSLMTPPPSAAPAAVTPARRRWWTAAAVAAALAAAGVIGALVLAGGGDDGQPDAAETTAATGDSAGTPVVVPPASEAPGTEAGGAVAGGAVAPQTSDRTGTATPGSGTEAQATVATSPTTRGPALGEPLVFTGTIDQADGRQNVHTIDGAIDDLLYVEGITPCGGADLRYSLTSPSGNLLINTYRVCEDAGRTVLSENGTHILTVFGLQAATGPYEIAVRPIPPDDVAAATIGGEPLRGTISAAGAHDVYTIDGAIDDLLYVEGITPCGGADLRYSLTSPSGNVLINTYRVCEDAGRTVLSENGTHILTVFGLQAATGPYEIAVRPIPPDDVAAATIGGEPLRGTISAAGAHDVYTIDGAIDDLLYLEGITPCGGADLRYSLTSPSGNVLINTYRVCEDAGPVTITENGPHTLTVFGLQAATGPYEVAVRAG